MEQPSIDNKSYRALSYGLFLLTAREGQKDNGCIVNTVQQLTSAPGRILVSVNKEDYTHDMILHTGSFNASVLTEEAPFALFQHFGFQSGRDLDKFAECTNVRRSANGLFYLTKFTNAFFSAKVESALDYGSHTLFVGEVSEAAVLGKAPSATYAYYFSNIKPKPQAAAKKKGYICKICGYVYEGDPLPPDFICPICKHGAADFEPLS